MSKHTQGNWRIEENEIVGNRYICTLANWHITGAGSKYPEENKKLQDEKEANARLIAAAPELLEACKELKDVVDELLCVPEFRKPMFYSMKKYAEQAISKAEGKE